MAKTRICSRTAWALFALGVLEPSAMAEDIREPSAEAPRSDQRRLRLLLSAGPLLDDSQTVHTSAALVFRVGTHTSAFAAIDYDWPPNSTTVCETWAGHEYCYRRGGLSGVRSQFGFRFASRPYSAVSPYFTVAYGMSNSSDDPFSRLTDPSEFGVVGGTGVEFPIRGRTRGFVGAQAFAFGNEEWGGVAYFSVKFGVNFGLK